MKILTISNLFPRPDKPEMGLYNYQLFRAMSEKSDHGLINICLVPEWRIWRWSEIRKWSMPDSISTSYEPVMYIPKVGREISSNLYCWSLKSRLRSVREVDFIYSSWLYPDGVVAAKIASDLSVPFALMVLGSDIFHLENPARRKLILQACRSAKGIICVAEHLKKALVDAGVDEGKVHVVENGVDGEMFKYRARDEVREKNLPTPHKAGSSIGLHRLVTPQALFSQTCDAAGVIKDEKIVLYVGNLVRIKGPDVLIDAFATLVEARRIQREESFARPRCPSASGVAKGYAETRDSPDKTDGDHACGVAGIVGSGEVGDDCQLIVIGEGKEGRRLEQQAERLGIADRVHFLGRRSHDEVALWMNVADCLCLSSRSEGMPNVVIEALTSGLPVVATDVGECSRMLADEPSSRVVVSDDVDMMAKALGDVLNMDVDRQAMAARYEGRYSWGKTAEEILERLPARLDFA